MQIHFSIEYETTWGESLCVIFQQIDNKGHNDSQLYQMNTVDGKNWSYDVNCHNLALQYIEYQYVVYKDGVASRYEWNVVPRKFFVDQIHDFSFIDYWKDIPTQSLLYSSAYTNCISSHIQDDVKTPLFNHTLYLHVQCPQVKQGQILGILGNQPVLGSWDPQRVLPMTCKNLHDWCISLSADGLKAPVEYKYVIIDEKSRELITWEKGDNRTTGNYKLRDSEVLVISNVDVKIDVAPWKGSGVVVPVFSLRSENSCGIGDFGDLKKMIGWAVMNKLRAIQILPINDTTVTHTWRDSYPYSGISVFALHPQFVDLRQLPQVKDSKRMEMFKKDSKRLNALSTINYEEVNQLKNSYLHLLFQQEGAKILAQKGYTQFFAQNANWLKPYAAFCYLRDLNSTSNFHEWPQYSVYNQQEIETLCNPQNKHYPDISFHYFVQYILHQQLSDVSTLARKSGIILKGDIPIGINRNSVETWLHPTYFYQEQSAGAPPDYFSSNGQNWGFPTYMWDAIAADDYKWWKDRLQHMALYFDAYRIDHVLGFFRIWEIPINDVNGVLGHFSPALPLSGDEIEASGLHFQADRFTKPYITNYVCDQIFGEYSSIVKSHYLNMVGYDRYEMKQMYDSPLKIKKVFSGKNDDQSIFLRNGLWKLFNEVLFIQDTERNGFYHPRFGANESYIYQMLSETERDAFNRIYDDFFFHRHNDFWYNGALKKLSALTSSTRMLVCAEDLGMVPDCVDVLLNKLGILSLEIQSMPKRTDEEFSHLESNPYNSVATITTHDMSPMRAWWEENAERAQRYYHQILQKDGIAPTVMPDWLCEEVISRHMFSPSMLCLISLQDWLSIDESTRRENPKDERINVPSDAHNKWDYRMHLTIEALKQKRRLNEKIKLLVERSGRE